MLNKSLNGLEGYDANNFYMDYELGQMLDILEKHGKADNTIVIYVNDNEAQLPRTKNTLYETGTRVPMVVRWPGVVEAGVTAAWAGIAGDAGRVIGVDRFGASAPAAQLFEHYGLTTENVARAVRETLA